MDTQSESNVKQFHLGTILSILHKDSPLISPDHMDGIYAILNFMTDGDWYTSSLPHANDLVLSSIQQQFPQLMTIPLKEITEENWKQKLDQWVTEYGEFHEVKKVDYHAHIDSSLKTQIGLFVNHSE